MASNNGLYELLEYLVCATLMCPLIHQALQRTIEFEEELVGGSCSSRMTLRDAIQTNVSTGTQNIMGLDLLMNMFGGLGVRILECDSLLSSPFNYLHKFKRMHSLHPV